ncbi:MAG: hypothetical protein VST67_15005, partial [Nitrospirota bacterium]|nr:hypothetical protein [Nitrospirota bacterium]
RRRMGQLSDVLYRLIHDVDEFVISARVMVVTPKLSEFLWRPAPIPCAPAIVKSLDRPNKSASVF